MKPNILKSNLFDTGTKFVATDDVKNNSLPPGSLGFFSSFNKPDRDYQDVVYGTVVIIRRGKGGRDRIELRNISFPIFTDKRMLEHEGYLPIGRKLYIHIEEKPFTEKSVVDLKPLEFLGWCYSYAKYLRCITENFIYPPGRAVWKEHSVGKAIINAERIPDYFADSQSNTLKVFTGTDFKVDFIVATRKLESRLTKCVCSYKKTVMASILNSSHFVDHTNKNHYVVVDEKLAKNTISFYKEKYDEISDLVERNKNVGKKKGA